MIKKVCVIGSGVMGSGIAAVMANSFCPVVLLDVVNKDVANRNQLLKNALHKMREQKPPPFTHPAREKYVQIGNLEDNLEYIKECDLVIEVIIEKLEIKHQLYQKIAPYLKKDAILASNTSTLPLVELKSKLPIEIQKRFMITHFFNPPRYMELLELVIDKTTEQKYIDLVVKFLNQTIGKTIVKCNDTPGFIANRIGCFLLELVVRKAIAAQLNPVIIDKIFTNLFKLPSTGIFGLYDLIGVDMMQLISNSLTKALPPNDDYHKIYRKSEIIERMLAAGLTGRKGPGGFYKMSIIEGKRFKETLDFASFSYHQVIDEPILFNNIKDLLEDQLAYGKFFRDILVQFYLYLTSLIPDVTNNIYDIDIAMRLGYSWKYGPFELINTQIPDGYGWLLSQIEQQKLKTNEFLSKQNYKNIDNKKFAIGQNTVNGAETLLSNNSAKLLSYKGALVFCITTKMNCLDRDVFNLILEAVDYAESKEKYLIIYPEGAHFSAGADLKFIANCIEYNDFKAISEFIKLGQQAMLRLKYSKINVISCAKGVALGGGCEILLHSDFIVAHCELNAGLVEMGVGLLPGWGGVKEMFLRSLANKDLLINNLKNIIKQNKTASADYFVQDYGATNIKIISNKNLLLEEALQLALPKKKLPDNSYKLKLPKIDLLKEMGEPLDDIQKLVISAMQDLFNSQETEERRLLEFELEQFMMLAKRPETLVKLKIYGK